MRDHGITFVLFHHLVLIRFIFNALYSSNDFFCDSCSNPSHNGQYWTIYMFLASQVYTFFRYSWLQNSIFLHSPPPLLPIHPKIYIPVDRQTGICWTIRMQFLPFLSLKILWQAQMKLVCFCLEVFSPWLLKCCWFNVLSGWRNLIYSI